jgi:hypothetical protein
MQHALRPYLTTGVAVVGASLIGVTPMAAPPDAQSRAIQLASVDSPLGDGPAYVMGGSTIAVPPQRYVDAIEQLYLQPLGYTGTAQGLFTPEGLYPVSGVKSLPFDESTAQGQKILDSTILQQFHDGNLSPENPAVVFGWSQSATLSSLTMSQLHEQGVPSDDVRFVFVGDPSAPNGGMLERFDVPIDGQSPTVPALGITFSGATPSELYPTDIYTAEYDGFADFPRYPIDFLSDLNAYLGILTEHTGYPVFTSDQIASATELPTSTADSMTHYYMVPAESLPLLAPLQLLPFIGQPLYDLLEPDMRILINLGYGNIEHGWDQGPADVPTTFGLFPDASVLAQVPGALANGLQQGITAAIDDLQDPANYDLSSILANPALTTFVDLLHTLDLTDVTDITQFTLPSLLEMGRKALGELVNFPTSDASLFSSSPTDIIDSITGTVSGDYASLLPMADTVNTLLTTVPSVLGSFVTEQLADGNLLDAIGDPIAAGLALVPFALIFGVGVPAVEALAGTLVNAGELFGLGEMAP